MYKRSPFGKTLLSDTVPQHLHSLVQRIRRPRLPGYRIWRTPQLEQFLIVRLDDDWRIVIAEQLHVLPTRQVCANLAKGGAGTSSSWRASLCDQPLAATATSSRNSRSPESGATTARKRG